ncbi:hypothetical protein G6F40_016797 [Rhizopus arrhizus]|nr:hypothetical protein G6F40_016797 [Rhizopus arrhizus]
MTARSASVPASAGKPVHCAGGHPRRRSTCSEGLGGGHGNPGWAGRESSRNDGRSVGSIHDPEEEFRRDQEAEPSHQCACRRRAVDDGRRCRPRRRVADP